MNFFDVVNDETLMTNYERGKNVQLILQLKIKEYYGSCNTILIREVLGKDAVILIQNAFPTLEKFINHVHTYKGVPVRVSDTLKQEILTNFKSLLRMKEHGINLFFTDVDKIKEQIMEELSVTV